MFALLAVTDTEVVLRPLSSTDSVLAKPLIVTVPPIFFALKLNEYDPVFTPPVVSASVIAHWK
jgi:hypothetical protein